MRWLVPLLVACHPHASGGPSGDPLPAITTLDRVAPLLLPLPDGVLRDCRPSGELRRAAHHAFAGTGVRPCGALDLSAPADGRGAARHCLEESFKRNEPFLVEQRLPDDTGVVAHSLFGAVEDGKLVVYRADYEAPACSVTCPVIRNLRMLKCVGASLQSCAEDLAACIRCESEDEFAACSLFDDRQGGR